MHATESRLDALLELEQALGYPVLAIYLGDRPQLETRLAQDLVRIVYEQLEAIGHVETLAIMLYTRGGDLLAPVRLVSLLREYCRHLHAIVHHRAHSAGTMLCIGCDRVLLSPLGELSPIDPSLSSPFTPKPDGNTAEISIEDVIGYLQLATDQAKLESESSRMQVFQRLADQIHPLALGSINRTYLGIRELANELLSSHANADITKEQRQRIVDTLSAGLRFHGRPISRSEANRLGLAFVEPIPPQIQPAVTCLHQHYAAYLGLNAPFNPDLEPPVDAPVLSLCLPAAVLESSRMTHEFEYGGTIYRGAQPPDKLPPGIQVPTTVLKWTSRQWRLVRDERGELQQS